MNILRNLPVDDPAQLESLIDIKENQVVSMALSKSKHFQMMLLAFSENESVSEEEYFGDTMYYVIEGETLVYKDGKEHHLKAGDVFMVPAHELHAIGGKGAFKLLQINLN